MRHLVAALFILIFSPQWCLLHPAMETNPNTETLSGNNNTFAFDLYSSVSTSKGNLFLSPESVSTALAVVYLGAAGETKIEMANSLHFSLDRQRFVSGMATRLKGLNSPPAGHSYQLTLADALWLEKDFAFRPEFLSVVQNDLGVTSKPVSFKTAPESARSLINDWVAQATAQKITNIMPPGLIDSRTRLVVTNAVYFKGDWLSSFDKAATHEEEFHPTPDSKHAVQMMHKTGTYSYFDSGDFQALELPYKGNDLSMIVFLPSAERGLGGFEATFTSANVQGWIGKLQETSEIQVSLPKFRLESEFQLKDSLATLGLKRAFETKQADFSGIAQFPKAENLHLSAVLHKAYVEVNEEGTEAAAATGVVARSSVMRRTTVFRADHPFVFLIRDRRSGAILFIGRVADPSD